MNEAICVVGVDWGRSRHAYVIRWGTQTRRGSFEAGPAAVHEWVDGLRSLNVGGKIIVALEQSRGALIYALEAYGFLELVPVNPRAAKAYRASLFLSGAKDDPVDAELLCDFVLAHHAKLRRWQRDDPTTRELRLLVEGRRTLVDQQTSTTQALTAVLEQYFPHMLSWFDDVRGRLARAFLKHWPTLAAAKNARRDSVIKLVRAYSRKKPEQIETLLSAIRGAVALTEDLALIGPMSLLAQSYVNTLDALEASISNFDKRIADAWSTHDDQPIFASFPGAGPVLAPRLAVAFGMDRTRYQDAVELQKYSGIAPVIERSGNKAWTHSRFHCPKFPKQTFHEFAAASLPFSPWALAFYRQQRDRGAGHHAAVRALAFRWIRVLFHCWKNNVTYDEQVHIDHLKRRGSPLVSRLAA